MHTRLENGTGVFWKLSVTDILGSEFHVEGPITTVSTNLVPALER